MGFNVKLDDAGTTILRGNWGRFLPYRDHGRALQYPSRTGHPLRSGTGTPTPGCTTIPGPNTKRLPISVSILMLLRRAPINFLSVSTGSWRPISRSASPMFGRTRAICSAGMWTTLPTLRFPGLRRTGQTIDVYPIASDPDDRYFRLSNVTCTGVSYRCDPMFMDYNGLVFTVNKRMSNNWQAQVSYVWSETYGLLPSSGFGVSSSQTTRVYGSSLARDPNQFINATGNLLNDRTHTFQAHRGDHRSGRHPARLQLRVLQRQALGCEDQCAGGCAPARKAVDISRAAGHEPSRKSEPLGFPHIPGFLLRGRMPRRRSNHSSMFSTPSIPRLRRPWGLRTSAPVSSGSANAGSIRAVPSSA